MNGAGDRYGSSAPGNAHSASAESQTLATNIVGLARVGVVGDRSERKPGRTGIRLLAVDLTMAQVFSLLDWPAERSTVTFGRLNAGGSGQPQYLSKDRSKA